MEVYECESSFLWEPGESDRALEAGVQGYSKLTDFDAEN